jgi:two-component system response regulator FixJ
MDPVRRRHVAIVDDDPGVLRALGRLVRSLGFDAETYPSGEALLAALAGSPPDDVLLDLHLPGLRGPEVIAALRRHGVAARVVVMTGLDPPGSREACLAAGAAAYTTKPIRRDDLAALLAGRPG